MPRSSRHKSHRSHKHSFKYERVWSDSEDDGSLKDRKHRVEEADSGSGDRVLRDVDPDKESSSSILKSQEKDKGITENGDYSAEHVRKQKERGEDCVTPDRWNGVGKDDGLAERGSREERFGPVDHEKADKSRISTVESKSRVSRRREGSLEEYGESNSRAEPLNRRSEKEYNSSRKDGRDDKEWNIGRISERKKDRELVSERDKKVQDSRHGKSDDVDTRGQRVAVEHRTTKKDSTGFQTRGDIHSVELSKDIEKCLTKRGNSFGGIGKWQDDSRKSEDKKLSSRDHHAKNGSHKVKGHKDGRYMDDGYRDKYYKDLDRDQRQDQRHREIRHREERSPRDYTSNRLESESVRDRDKSFESCSKKSKSHGIDCEVSLHGDDHGVKSKNIGLRKSSYDENDEHYSLKRINEKETCCDVEKDASKLSKLEYRYHGKGEYSLTNNLSKCYSSPNSDSSKDQKRRCIKQADYTHREPVSDDRARPTDDHDSISVIHEGVSESPSEKVKRRDRVSSDDREQQLSVENPSMHNHLQPNLQNGEHIYVPPSSFKRTSHFPGSASGHHHTHPPMRNGMDSPTIYGDENRNKSGDRRSNSHYKRSCDPNIERGQGLAWKNGPTWSASVPNGFIPFQHGPGFHSAIQHFPPPSLFGPRPYMEINQAGIPYHMHDVVDRFPGHGHPFGWHHSADDSCPPQMQGSIPFFVDKSHAYGRSVWEQNRHLIGGRGWKLNAEMWKGHSPSMNVELCAPQEQADESKGAYSNQCSNSEGDLFQHVSGDTTHLKEHMDHPENKSIETSLKAEFGRTSIPKRQKVYCQNLCNYFSRIEISSDLIDPDLYNEFRNHFSTCNSTGFYNIYEDEDSKNNRVQILAIVSNPSSLPPTAADSAFKRAMSVYEKQSCGRKVKLPPPALPAEEWNISSVATNAININAPGSFATTKEALPANAISLNEMEKLGSNTSVARSFVEEDVRSSPLGNTENSPAHIKVSHVAESPDNNCKQQPDIISDVLVESSQACELVMPDCKVNISRIHNTPGSTH